MFITAHELLHGSAWLDKAAASALLAFSGYMHWTESHLAHHVKVSCRHRCCCCCCCWHWAVVARGGWGKHGHGLHACLLLQRNIGPGAIAAAHLHPECTAQCTACCA